MKKHLFFAAFALAALSSCAVEPIETEIPAEPLEQTGGKMITIRAGFDATTRTVVDGTKVLWSPGDQICVLTFSGLGVRKSCFTTNATAPCASADFYGFPPESNYNEPSYWLVYPYSENIVTNGSALGFTVPTEQTAVPGSFAKDTYVAIAQVYGDDPLHEVHFQHLLGGLRITVNEPGISKITLRANGGEQLSGGAGTSTAYRCYDYSTGMFSLDTQAESIALGNYNYFYPNEGPSYVTLTPESGTFIPGEEYFFVTRPCTLEKGFSLDMEKADGTGARVSINKQVEIRRAEFRTLEECDKNYDWSTAGVSFDKETIELDAQSGGFQFVLTCPGEYTMDPVNADWLTEIIMEDPDGTKHTYAPFHWGWAYNFNAPESYGTKGDARFEGHRYMFGYKANPDAAPRSATINFRYKGNTYSLTVNQAGNTLPAIPRHHLGMIFCTLDGNMTSGWKYGPYSDAVEYFGQDKFDYVAGFYGQRGCDQLLGGKTLSWSYSRSTWSVVDGHSDMDAGVSDSNMSQYVIDLAKLTDDYYLPMTSLGMSSVYDAENKKVTVSVDVYAAKAGTYKLTGLLVDNYVLSGTTLSSYPYTRIVSEIVPDYNGQEITIAADGTTQNYSFEIPVREEYRGYGGTWGILENYYLIFYVRAPYGAQAVIGASEPGWYIDNSRRANFGETLTPEVAGL